MLANVKEPKLLSVRISESELRRVKSLAASRGMSLQSAVQQALQAWGTGYTEERPEPLTGLEGSLAHVDVQRLLNDEREAEAVKDRSRL